LALARFEFQFASDLADLVLVEFTQRFDDGQIDIFG
jgi:hypothetical protein